MAYIGNAPAEAYTNTVKDTFSGNGSTVAFTLSLPSTTNNVRVVVENVIQDPTVAYSVSGTTLTFTSAPPSGTDNIYAVHLGPAVQTVQPPTELSGNFTLTGDLTQTGDYGLWMRRIIGLGWGRVRHPMAFMWLIRLMRRRRANLNELAVRSCVFSQKALMQSLGHIQILR
jgi:hypothetical protein